MKKIFLSFLAIIAMVGMVSAQRTWAYGLNMTQEGDNYTFVFKSTTAATAANLVFTDAAGEVAGKVALENVVAGENTKVLALADIPGEGTLNWAVELTGAAIEGVTEVTAAEDKYYYYLAQDVAANVNPESEHFGKMYVLETYKGAGDGASAHSKTQSQGIYVYDPMLNLENYAEGYLPSNVTLNTAAAGKLYRELHRMAINPVKDELAFVQSTAVKVWLAKLDDLNAEATNVAAETGIKASSLCYDENGTLYVLDPFAATATIYKQVDGEFVKFVERDNWGWTDDRNAMESDGRGGLWVVQNIADLATNGHSEDMLTHINAAGEVDFYVNKTSSAELQALMPAASNRGQIGYDAKNDVLALGGKGTVKLFNVTYTENGPTLTLWQTVTLGGGNVDGLAFDYAGDLIAMSASVERFYKFALPTADNTCVTPAKKAQVIVKETTEEPVDPENPVEPEEPTYEIYEVEINDLSIDLDNLILYGSASANFDVEVMLGLGEVIDMNTGVYQLNPESYVGINGSDATFVEGTAYDIDAFAPAAKAVVRCIWNGMNIELQLNMSAAPLEATVVVVENAAVEIEKFIIFGDVYDYSLKMTGTWYNEADETTYPVLVEVPVYYPEATEPSTITSTVTVGDWVDENGPWLGFGEGDLTIETVDGVVTATGVVQNPMTGIAIDITISGTLPQGPTGVENNTINVKAMKVIRDGQLIIRNNGVEYNAQGAQL